MTDTLMDGHERTDVALQLLNRDPASVGHLCELLSECSLGSDGTNPQGPPDIGDQRSAFNPVRSATARA